MASHSDAEIGDGFAILCGDDQVRRFINIVLECERGISLHIMDVKNKLIRGGADLIGHLAGIIVIINFLANRNKHPDRAAFGPELPLPVLRQ